MSKDYTLFCMYADDVRQENTGKPFLIGLYQGGMNVAGTLPVRLAQLVVMAHVIVDNEAPPIRQLKLSIHVGDKLLIEVEPPQDAISDASKNLPDKATAEPSIFQVTVGLQPFLVEHAGRLHVSARINGKHTVKGNSLTIRHTPQGKPSPPN